MSLQHKEEVRDREGRERFLNHVQNCCSRILYGNPSNWTKRKGSWQKELFLRANVVVICLRIMLIVSKSQLGKHGVYLKKLFALTKLWNEI